ncbi:MAG: hypothetical protein LAO77_18300 [Acidobacteriia bacterium]|nr:hypothetical protein [Terriglobia bacterium]
MSLVPGRPTSIAIAPPCVAPAMGGLDLSRRHHATHRVALRIGDPGAGAIVCQAAVAILQTIAAQDGLTLEFAPWTGSAIREARHLNGSWDAVYAIDPPLHTGAAAADPYVSLRSIRAVPGARWCDRPPQTAGLDSRWLLAPPAARHDDDLRDRLALFACELADARRQRLLCVTDAHDPDGGAKAWKDTLAAAAVNVPGVLVETADVAAAALTIRTDPHHLDVILTTTARAALLAELCAGRFGCAGLDPLVQVDVSGWQPPIVTATAGVESEWLGAPYANPLGAIWAGALVLDCLGHHTAYARIMSAVDRALVGAARPFAIGGRATAADFSRAVREELQSEK